MLGSGNKYFDIHGEGAIDVMGTFTFEGNSSANAIWTAHHADPPTFQAIRLSCSGAQIGTGTNLNIKIDIGGIWTEVIPLASEDKGNNLTTAILQSHYDTTGAKHVAVEVTTNTNTI